MWEYYTYIIMALIGLLAGTAPKLVQLIRDFRAPVERYRIIATKRSADDYPARIHRAVTYAEALRVSLSKPVVIVNANVADAMKADFFVSDSSVKLPNQVPTSFVVADSFWDERIRVEHSRYSKTGGKDGVNYG